MGHTPSFSVVIPTYNRARVLKRCIESCFSQTEQPAEIIVVDDASDDETPRMLADLAGGNLRVVRHAENRGICPARNTGALEAGGDWVVTIDSDWALKPHCLERLRAVAAACGPRIGAIGARLQWDNGWVTPRFVPAGPIGYGERLRWCEAEGGTDHLFCARRSTYDRLPWPERRGGVESLYQLDFCLQWDQLFLDEILGLEFTDGAGSFSRDTTRRAVRSLLRDSGDRAASIDELLERHGLALAKWAPNQFASYLRAGSISQFLAGNRRRGVQRLRQLVELRGIRPSSVAILLIGLLGRKATAVANIAKRRVVLTRES